MFNLFTSHESIAALHQERTRRLGAVRRVDVRRARPQRRRDQQA